MRSPMIRMTGLRPKIIMTRRFIWHYFGGLAVHPVLDGVEGCGDDFGRGVHPPQVLGGGLYFGGHGLDGLLGPRNGNPIAIVNRNVKKPSVSRSVAYP